MVPDLFPLLGARFIPIVGYLMVCLYPQALFDLCESDVTLFL